MNAKEKSHMEIIWGQIPDPVFLKMQQNIPLHMLAPLKTIKEVGEKREFEYSVTDLITVETLLHTGRFNMRLFVHLLKTLETLNLQLEQYMLSMNMLIFREDAVYFSTARDEFVWLLLPFDRDKEIVAREKLQFFRHLMIELEQCHVMGINTLLSVDHFSLSELQSLYLSQNVQLTLPDQESEPVTESSEYFKKIKKLFRIKSNGLNKSKSKKPVRRAEWPENITSQPALNLKKTAYVQRHPLLLSRDQPAVQYKVYYETCLIGRDDRCEICIDETSISREHAKLYSQSGAYFIEDLNSTNGTCVNSEKISSKIRIKHGDELRIGHCDFIFLI